MHNPHPKAPATKMDAAKAMHDLKGFIGNQQLNAIANGARSDDKQFFFDKMVELAETVRTMPKTYGQDGKGNEAIAYLHYFTGAADFYITEKDMEDEQLQAFGLADYFGDGGEIGYISIVEIVAAGAELDFHFTPQTIAAIKEKRSHAESESPATHSMALSTDLFAIYERAARDNGLEVYHSPYGFGYKANLPAYDSCESDDYECKEAAWVAACQNNRIDPGYLITQEEFLSLHHDLLALEKLPPDHSTQTRIDEARALMESSPWVLHGSDCVLKMEQFDMQVTG